MAFAYAELTAVKFDIIQEAGTCVAFPSPLPFLAYQYIFSGV